jgi:hypothetical protein
VDRADRRGGRRSLIIPTALGSLVLWLVARRRGWAFWLLAVLGVVLYFGFRLSSPRPGSDRPEIRSTAGRRGRPRSDHADRPARPDRRHLPDHGRLRARDGGARTRSGCCSWPAPWASTRRSARRGPAEQLELIWANIARILASAGMTVDNIVRLTSYLRDAQYAEANGDARVRALGGRAVPTTAIVAQTLVSQWLVEIEVIAAG